MLNGNETAVDGGYAAQVRPLTLLLALCALAAAGCGGGTADDEAATPVPPVTETAAPEDTAMRPTAPPIAGRTLEGNETSLADLRGKQVVVNVWSSW